MFDATGPHIALAKTKKFPEVAKLIAMAVQYIAKKKFDVTAAKVTFP